MFEILFLTTFIKIKTLYDQIGNICVRLVKSLNFSNLENFGDNEREPVPTTRVLNPKAWGVQGRSPGRGCGGAKPPAYKK